VAFALPGMMSADIGGGLAKFRRRGHVVCARAEIRQVDKNGNSVGS
jgi:hypothetical protein